MIFVRPSEIRCAAPCPGGRKSCARPLLKVSGGVEKHRGQGERIFSCKPPTINLVLPTPPLLVLPLILQSMAPGPLSPRSTWCLRCGCLATGVPSLLTALLPRLLVRSTSLRFWTNWTKLRLPAMTLATRRPARSWRSRFSSPIGYFQGVHEEKIRIQLSKQLTHLPGWCSGWPIELEPRITEI